MRRAAAICCLILLATTCAAIPKTITTDTNWPEFVQEGKIHPLTEAITECRKGRAVVIVRSIDIPPIHMAEIWAHERVHVEQMMSRTPEVSCEQYERWMTSRPNLLLQHEAAAYCAQARWAILNKPEGDPLLLLLDAAGGQAAIFRTYNEREWMIPPQNIAALFIGWCPEAAQHVHSLIFPKGER